MATFIVGDKKFSSRNGENFNTARKHAKQNGITVITETVHNYHGRGDRTFTHTV